MSQKARDGAAREGIDADGAELRAAFIHSAKVSRPPSRGVLAAAELTNVMILGAGSAGGAQASPEGARWTRGGHG